MCSLESTEFCFKLFDMFHKERAADVLRKKNIASVLSASNDIAKHVSLNLRLPLDKKEKLSHH